MYTCVVYVTCILYEHMYVHWKCKGIGRQNEKDGRRNQSTEGSGGENEDGKMKWEREKGRDGLIKGREEGG